MNNTFKVASDTYFKLTYIDQNVSLKKIYLKAKNKNEGLNCVKETWGKYPIWYMKIVFDEKVLFEQKRFPNFSKEQTKYLTEIIKLTLLLHEAHKKLNRLEKDLSNSLEMVNLNTENWFLHDIDGFLERFTDENNKVLALNNLINKRKLSLSSFEMEILDRKDNGVEHQVEIAEKVWKAYDKIENNADTETIYDRLERQEQQYTCDNLFELFEQ